MKTESKLKRLTPEIVVPILQGLLASGHYTSEGGNLLILQYDSGPARSIAINAAIQIARDVLAQVDDANLMDHR